MVRAKKWYLTARANGPIVVMSTGQRCPPIWRRQMTQSNDARLTRMEADIAEIMSLLKQMYPLLVAVDARSQEQSNRISDMSRIVTALIPSKIAAVG